ncbi:MAG TPA: ATP-binding protein [Acidimicrobiales bacterium]|jgi:two-component sensor histidine kinase|nr:ATP-binding protein [Acidimicrobiales bacterium]
MSAERRFGSDPTSAAAGRQFVSDATADLSSETREQVALMVSELATNSLVHAATGFKIRIDRSDTRIRIEVSDVGGGQPILRSPATSDPHGRGLQIVKALADNWGTTERPEHSGKTVWFELSFPPEGRSGHVGSAGRSGRGREAGDPDPARLRGSSHHFASPLRSLIGGH